MAYKVFKVLGHMAAPASIPILSARALILSTSTYDLLICDGAVNRYASTPPVGAPYVRMPGDPLPGTLYPGTTWTKVSGGAGSGALQGTFPRFDGQYTGHEAATYNVVQTSQNKSHSHGGATGGMSANNPHTHTAKRASNVAGTYGETDISSSYANDGGINAADIAHTHSISADGGTEARPVAVGIEHYRRTA